MATTLDTLVKRTRRFLRDYPAPASALTISLASNGTSITVADTTILAQNYVLEVDYENLLVQTINSATNATVARGWAGSTAVSHVVSSSVLVRPAFFAPEIIDALNQAKDEMYPYVYKTVIDTSLSGDNVTYEFTVPSTIRHLSSVEVLQTGDTAYRPMRAWSVRRGATPKIVFRRPPVAGTLRLNGFGTFDDLAASADTIDTLFPANAEKVLTLGAASVLLASGEAGRSRQDVGLRDDREAAIRPGNAISLANQLERRFRQNILNVMPPMGKNVVAVI